MISLKMNKDRLSNHLHYGKWYYIVAVLGALVVFSMIHTVTEPKTPDYLKVDITVYGSYMDEIVKKDWQQDLLALLPEDQKEVNIYSMSMGEEDYNMMEIVVARMTAQEDDIIIMNTERALAFATQGVFKPLEEYIAPDDIRNLPEDFDWDAMYVAEEGSDDGKMLFILPLDGAYGLTELGVYPGDMSIAIMTYSENFDNALRCVQYILDQTELPGA